MIPFKESMEILRNIKYVNATEPQYDMAKTTACKKSGAGILCIGGDRYGTEKGKGYEKQFEEAGVKIIYFAYAKRISSTKTTPNLNNVLQ